MSKVRETLNNVLKQFKNGNIPEAISYAVFPIPDIPASKWSLLNRTLIFIAGTYDARGIRQWNEIGRRVKKGTKAIYILAPRVKKLEEEEKSLLTGFLAVPVFRYQDTEGEPIPEYYPELPELPFIEVAREWGISVNAIPGNYQYYGFYSSARKEIAVATKEESVFFHELCHAAHDKIKPIKPGQDPIQEIVAELGAAVLCAMVGKVSKYIGNNYRYIEHYARKLNLSPLSACLKVFSEVEQVINLITRRTADEKI